jgi:hypothetical protein
MNGFAFSNRLVKRRLNNGAKMKTITVLLTILLAGGSALAQDAEEKTPASLEVELKPYPIEVEGHSNFATVRFTNSGNKVVRILRPLDGSEHSWVMPFYRVTVVDDSGKTLGLFGRCASCGLWADIKWPDDYIIQIMPGDSYEMRVDIYQDVPKSGNYKVTFEYVFDPDGRKLKAIIDKYPEGLWRGTARSKDISLKLKSSR